MPGAGRAPEGTYDYFHRSGTSDLDAFVLQDFFGAGLFHFLDGVVIAVVFGLVAAALARTRRPPSSAHVSIATR